jgi:hypothetical protein
MKNVFLIILLLLLLPLNSLSQGVDTLKTVSKNSKIEQSLAIQPLFGFDYTWAYQQSKHFGFGFSVRYGLTGELIIYHPSLMKDYGYCNIALDDYSVFGSSEVKIYVPLLGFSIFYRNYFAKNGFFDAGVFGSLGFSSVADKNITDFTRTIGGYLSVSYGFEKVKFSHELQIAAFDVQWFSKNVKGKPIVFFIPLIIRFRL